MAYEASIPENDASEQSALTFLRWLYGDDPPGWITISTFDSQPTQWFPANQIEQVAHYCQAIARRYNCYFGLGLRKERLEEGRGENSDVLGIPGFWIELDIKHPVHKKVNLPETIEQAVALVQEAIPLKPSIIIDSGYGVHVHWLFRELWLFDGAEDRQAAYHLLHRLQATVQGVAKLHSWEVDSTFDLARVLRIPGTYNRNVPDHPKPVTILEADPNRRYNPSDFLKHLIDVEEMSYQETTGTTFDGELRPVDIQTLKIPAWLKYLIHVGHDPDYVPSDSTRSAAEFKALQGLIEAGLDDSTIMSLMLDPRYGISEKPREKGQKWLANDLTRAHAKLNGHRSTSRTSEPEPSEAELEGHHTAEQGDDQQQSTDPKLYRTFGGVSETANGYYRIRTIKEKPIRTQISSFIVQPTLRIWVDGSEAVRANIMARNDTLGEVTIERHCWHSRGAFLKVLTSLDQWCIATDAEGSLETWNEDTRACGWCLGK
jgi:hypothetical protein